MDKFLRQRLLLITLLLSSCAGIQPTPKIGAELTYKKCDLSIACPNQISYYAITFNNDGDGLVNFCFEKRDSGDNLAGEKDSIIKLISFHVPAGDKRRIDNLLINMPSMSVSSNNTAHDTFKYTLKLDDEFKNTAYDSETALLEILKILSSHFSNEIRKFDYCGFFELLERQQ